MTQQRQSSSTEDNNKMYSNNKNFTTPTEGFYSAPNSANSLSLAANISRMASASLSRAARLSALYLSLSLVGSRELLLAVMTDAGVPTAPVLE